MPHAHHSPASADWQAVDGEFESLDYSHAQNPGSQNAPSLGERKLWCAVIEQAFVDIGAIAPMRLAQPSCRTPAGTGKEHDAALRWLLRDNSDFHRACLLAGVSPDVIRRAAQAFYAMQCAHPKG